VQAARAQARAAAWAAGASNSQYLWMGVSRGLLLSS